MYFRVLLFTICLFLISCTEHVQAPLRIGTNIWPGYEPLYVTQKKSSEFLNKIKFIEYRNASQVLNGIINDSIDVAAVTLDEAVKIKALGYDIQVIWVIDESYGADALISMNSETIEALKGKKIGVETSALGAYFLRRFLEKKQFEKNDFDIVNLEVNRHLDAIKQGTVDAVLTFDPVKSKLLEAGATNLFDSTKIPGEIIDVLIVSRANFSTQQQVTLSQFLKAHARTVTAINSNIKPYYHSLNNRLNLSETQFFDSFSQIKLFELGRVEQWLTQAEQQQQLIKRYSDVLLEEQTITQACDCEHLVSTHILELVKNEK